MPARSRSVRGALAAVLAAAPLAIVACHPVHPGAAAIVGQHAISVDTLQKLTNRVVAVADDQTRPQIAGDAAARAKLQRSILSRLIDNELLETAAKDFHISVSEGEIDQEQAQLEQQAGGKPQLMQQAALSGIAPSELRTALRGLVLGGKISNAVVADVAVSPTQLQQAYNQNIDQFDQVHAAHILVTNKVDADQILARARANPASFAALAARYSEDTASKSSGGDLGQVGRSRLDPSFAGPVFAAKPGSIIEVHSSFGWHVVHVIAHPVETVDEAAPQLRASILQNLSQQRVTALLTRITRQLHISVNPRYGSWSVQDRAVNPLGAADELSRPKTKPTPAPTLPTGTNQPPSG